MKNKKDIRQYRKKCKLVKILTSVILSCLVFAFVCVSSFAWSANSNTGVYRNLPILTFKYQTYSDDYFRSFTSSAFRPLSDDYLNSPDSIWSTPVRTSYAEAIRSNYTYQNYVFSEFSNDLDLDTGPGVLYIPFTYHSYRGCYFDLDFGYLPVYGFADSEQYNLSFCSAYSDSAYSSSGIPNISIDSSSTQKYISGYDLTYKFFDISANTYFYSTVSRDDTHASIDYLELTSVDIDYVLSYSEYDLLDSSRIFLCDVVGSISANYSAEPVWNCFALDNANQFVKNTNNGYDNLWSNLFSNFRIENETNIYENGFDNGFDSGYYDGLIEGEKNAFESTDGFITSLLKGIDGFLSAEIFPGFTFGLMLSVLVGFSCLIWLLKFLAGG